MSKDLYKDVTRFHEDVLHAFSPHVPTMVSQDFMEERLAFILEETEEFMTATREGNMVDAADALADIVYVALGTAYLMGLPFESIWDSVQAANMRKVRGMTKRGNACDAAKPAGWVGPETEIAAAIRNKLD